MKVNDLFEGVTLITANDKLSTYASGYLKPNTKKELSIKNKTITTLKGLFPEVTYSNVRLNRLNITSLEGSPKEVMGDFQCVVCDITDLKGGPERVQGDYWVGNNDLLSSLEGAPRYIGGNALLLWNPKLKDIHNIHKHMPEVHGEIMFGNSVRKNALGLLLIKGLKGVSGIASTSIQNIINRFLPNNRGMEAVFECQEALIEFGSEGAENYAHL